jgi:alpha-L-fucosidase 2
MRTIKHHWMGLFVAAVLLSASIDFAADDSPLPSTDQNLVLAAPITHWDEAIPLGNGLMGGLLWGEGTTVRLSLDRGDLWDERPAGEKDWWKTRTWKAGGDWDSPYNGVTPTKLPAGRLEITLDSTQQLKQFELNLATAEGFAWLSNRKKLSAFFSDDLPVAIICVDGPEPEKIELIPSGSKNKSEGAGPGSGGAVSKLGYLPAQAGSEGSAKWYVQSAADGLKYCVCADTRRVADQTIIAVAVTSTRDGDDVLALARQRCSMALSRGYAKLLVPHAAWWKKFWQQSSVWLPEIDFQKYYVLSQYLYGAASRRGAPPMPLQGVWTADNGGLPPWKGDYHNDLNTQMTYMAYQESGRFDQGASYLDFLWDLAPTFHQFAHDFYGTEGLACPGVMSLAGQPLGGWGQYSMSPTMSAWSAHLFYLHWRYTMDDGFLRERAYPWCSQVGICMLGLLKPDANGVLKLQRSSSPEIFDDSPRAWLEPNSNYDLSCLKMLFLSLEEMADACGKTDAAARWATAAAGLGDFHTDANDMLLLDAKTPLPGSHRHLSHLIGLYPFNLITCEGDQQARRRIKASLDQWEHFGTRAWCGYTFAWTSCMSSRVGQAEPALRNLDIFIHAFILRNGFHANGDQTHSGYSGFTYRPFTLEGNFLASQAVQEMLLQSWSPTPGRRDTEIIRLFPSTPWRWHDVSFTDLRAEGGYKVSGRRENNATVWFRIVASRDGVLRVRDNFDGQTPKWNLPEVKKVGDRFEVNLAKGQVLEATLDKPSSVPPEPGDVAKPVSTGHRAE